MVISSRGHTAQESDRDDRLRHLGLRVPLCLLHPVGHAVIVGKLGGPASGARPVQEWVPSTAMPTPLPADADTNLHPPDAPEVELQTMLLDATFEAMTGVTVHVADLAPISAAAYGRGLARRNEAFRSRMVQSMIMGALVLRPCAAGGGRAGRRLRAGALDRRRHAHRGPAVRGRQPRPRRVRLRPQRRHVRLVARAHPGPPHVGRAGRRVDGVRQRPRARVPVAGAWPTGCGAAR